MGELKKKETHSCMQYLNLLKAERGGDITVQVHLPYLNDGMDTDNTPWYKRSLDTLSRDRQNNGRLMEALERVYLPVDGDTDEWNGERKKKFSKWHWSTTCNPSLRLKRVVTC